MKYKVGDRVRIKSLDWYNENKDNTGRVVCGNLSLGCLNKGYCGKVFTIDKVYIDYYTVKENSAFWNDMMIEGLVEEETTSDKVIEEAKTYWDSIKDAWICPEGYQFVDENGNIINTTKIVLEKPCLHRCKARKGLRNEVQISDHKRNGRKTNHKRDMKYCMDCGHYIAGGGEHNCQAATKPYKSHVCALKEACRDFIERTEKEKMVFDKIQMRKPRKRKTY